MRWKVHGIQEIRGLRFTEEELVEELKEISVKDGI